MTRLTLAARNLLVQDPDIFALVGKSPHWQDGWVFDSKPIGVRLENSQRSWIVINESGNWQPRNQHNTQTFPRLQVDIWADPTRNEDNSVAVNDADDKIGDLRDLLSRYFHLVNLDVPQGAPSWMGTPGYPRIWGTAEEISDKTGVVVTGSMEIGGPDLSDVSDGNGARMGRIFYGVTVS